MGGVKERNPGATQGLWLQQAEVGVVISRNDGDRSHPCAGGLVLRAKR